MSETAPEVTQGTQKMCLPPPIAHNHPPTRCQPHTHPPTDTHTLTASRLLSASHTYIYLAHCLTTTTHPHPHPHPTGKSWVTRLCKTHTPRSMARAAACAVSVVSDQNILGTRASVIRSRPLCVCACTVSLAAWTTGCWPHLISVYSQPSLYTHTPIYTQETAKVSSASTS